MDFVQLVEDYAVQNPQIVMETPQVTVSMYPESGSDRVVELKFTYQTSRDALRNMQTQVATVVDAAVDMVSVTTQPKGKYAQMYALLMERFQVYTQETSITPAYSMLVYGVGDSRAFATVYAALCRQADLECLTVVGARDGELRYWNIINIDGIYYHVDLLRCKEEGQFREMTDAEMEGYVWDYSAYPACGGVEEAPQRG
jgi:transglutaminase-like putative cysteine protease